MKKKIIYSFEKLNKELNNLIQQSRYKDAFILFEESDFDKITSNFDLYVEDNPTEVNFKFIAYLGEHSQRENDVSFASMMLATSLCHYNRAYYLSYELAKKALNINSGSIENWEWLLFFYDLPNKVMNKEELRVAIVSLLKLDPTNKKAIEFIKKYFLDDLELNKLV